MDFSAIPPHPGQMRLIRAMREFQVVLHSPGRRWGKSSARYYIHTDQIMRRPGWVQGLYGSQDHATAAETWASDLEVFQSIGAVPKDGFKNEDQRRYIDIRPMSIDPVPGHPPSCECDDCYEANEVAATLKGGKNEGGRIWYPSLGPEAHNKFQGKGLQYAILDEFSHIPMAAWDVTVEPMLSDTGGPALIVGTPIPDGINFAGFAEMCERAATTKGWHYSSGPSEENPHINHASIRQKRADLVARGRAAMAACLYDGKFVTDIGAVFLNLDAVFCLKAPEVEPGLWIYRYPQQDEPVVVGVDFGYHDDATVIVAFSKWTMEQLALQRIERTEFVVQLPAIDRFARMMSSRQIWAEGRDLTAADLMRRRFGDVCRTVAWTGAGQWSKNDAVHRGMDLFERAAWRLIDAKWQKEEFRNFARDRSGPDTPRRYNAPDGKHDDAVAACLYASYGLPLSAQGPRVQPPRLRMAESTAIIRAAKGTKDNAQPFSLRRSY
jgi:hypothetical protein